MEAYDYRKGNKTRLRLSAKRRKIKICRKRKYVLQNDRQDNVKENIQRDQMNILVGQFTMEWNHERCLDLINLYKVKPELWDTTHRFYYVKTKKLEAVNEIASKLNTTTEIIKTKLNSLTTSFRRERTKVINSLGTGREYVSQWFGYKAFEFLMDRNKCRKSINASRTTSTPTIIIKEEFSETSEDLENVNNDELYDQETKYEETESEDPLVEDVNTKETYNPTRGLKRKLPVNANLDKDPHPYSATDFNIMQSYGERRDACDIYGEHIAMKLRTYSKTTQNIVQHLINNILFDADMGKYDQEGFNTLSFTSSNSHF